MFITRLNIYRTIILATFSFMVLVLGSCSSIPISLDPSTYVTYREIVAKQKTELKHPLIGLYRIAFLDVGIKEKPENTKPVNGDWKVAAVLRGAEIDFVSLSGYKGFGVGSDQGGSFSVNLQGATLWSVPYENPPHNPAMYTGRWSGIMGAGYMGVSTLLFMKNGWLRIQTSYTLSQEQLKKVQDSDDQNPTDNDHNETAFLSIINQ